MSKARSIARIVALLDAPHDRVALTTDEITTWWGIVLGLESAS